MSTAYVRLLDYIAAMRVVNLLNILIKFKSCWSQGHGTRPNVVCCPISRVIIVFTGQHSQVAQGEMFITSYFTAFPYLYSCYLMVTIACRQTSLRPSDGPVSLLVSTCQMLASLISPAPTVLSALSARVVGDYTPKRPCIPTLRQHFCLERVVHVTFISFSVSATVTRCLIQNGLKWKVMCVYLENGSVASSLLAPSPSPAREGGKKKTVESLCEPPVCC